MWILAIIVVMYFFLLHARYEGVRYAPTNFERWLVMILCSGFVGALLAMVIGNGIPRPGDDPWLMFLSPLVMYLCSIPLRMLFRFKIPNIEQLLIFLGLFGVIGYAVMLPMFAKR